VSEQRELQTPRGWYADPAGSGGWRYFDGQTWTDHVQQEVKNLAAPQLRKSAAPLANRLQQYYLPAAALLVGLNAFLQFRSRDLLHIGHAVVEFIRRGDANAPLPSLASNTSGWESVIGQLANVATVVTFVMFLVWQYRSHTEAQNFGYPMGISRALAIWSWFIPVANLFLPFKALGELLPPDHKNRRVVWFFCACNAAKILGVALLILSIWSGSLGWWTLWFLLTFVTGVGTQLLRRQIIAVTEANHNGFLKTLR